MWNDAISPYDLLGVQETATAKEIRKAFYDMSKLYHPDRNQGLDLGTEHFVKCKKAYDILKDPSLRRIYDGCLLQRERLARKSMYSAAVSNTPEFRDVVDEQFQNVFDPETIRGDALVLCCESCGAPSKFRCNICDMLTCAFCATKQHANDIVPPHYPVQYSPSFKRKMEAKERQQRLYKKQQERSKALKAIRKTEAQRTLDTRYYRRARKRVGDGEIAGKETKHAELAKCYAWIQSENEILFALWVPFPVDDRGRLTFDVHHKKQFRVAFTEPQEDSDDEEYRKNIPVVDGRWFYGDIDGRVPLDCAVFPETQVVVGKLKKLESGRWPCLFQGDSDLLRDAGDHDRHSWRLDVDLSPDDYKVYVVDVVIPRSKDLKADDIDVEVSARSLTVKVPDWPTWSRHLIYPTKTDACWTLHDTDGRIVVSIALTFANLPEDPSSLFVEDDDDLQTSAFVQVAAHLHFREGFLDRADLLDTAQDILKALEIDRPRSQQSKPLTSLFATTKTKEAPPNIKRWYARALLDDEMLWRKKNHVVKKKKIKKTTSTVVAPTPEKIDSFTAPQILHLFEDSKGLEREDIASFAWDGGDEPIVKVYLSLGGHLDELTVDDVAVRFDATAIAVHVKHPTKLLCFQCALFHTVVPKKSTLKIHSSKRLIALALKKKVSDLLWTSLHRDVNLLETQS